MSCRGLAGRLTDFCNPRVADIDPTEKHFVSSGFDKLIKVWEPEELDF